MEANSLKSLLSSGLGVEEKRETREVVREEAVMLDAWYCETRPRKVVRLRGK